jgi:ornithine carbamoyltransferase
MVKVYFEMEGGSYSELVAIFDNEVTYMACLPALEVFCKECGFDKVTESVVDQSILEIEE